MLLEDILYYRKSKSRWERGKIRLHDNGEIFFHREDFLLTMINNKLDLYQSAPGAAAGYATRFQPDYPMLEGWMDPNLLLFLPNTRNSNKNLWLLFANYQQMR